jgi:hypothetical protein
VAVVYIHGVATRATEPSARVERLVRRYLAPELAVDPDSVPFIYAYWGGHAAHLAWDGASRPRTPLLGQGGHADAEQVTRTITALELSRLMEGLPHQAEGSIGPLAPSGPSAGLTAEGFRLKDLTPDQLSDLVATTLDTLGSNAADLLIAADDLVHDPETFARLSAAPDLEGEWRILTEMLEAEVGAGLAPMGGGGFLGRVGDRLRESVGRGVGLPGFVASRMVAELRPGLNEMASLFLGDILTYLNARGDATEPGPIPTVLLDALSEARRQAPDQPLVLISHSMGGQITYDVLTHFLPRLSEGSGTRVDFWCATASQVGFFEELKLFLESRPEHRPGSPVPFPAHLGRWWNVWDHNDFLSFTARGIFAGVEDEGFDSGMSLVGAHSGYLSRPSFYRRFAERLRLAAGEGFSRP